MRISRPLTVLGAVLIIALGGVAVAYSLTPGQGGVISACYDKGGNVKLIDNGGTCPKGYSGPISWNQQGVPGEDGEDGFTGIHLEQRTVDPTPGQNSVTGLVFCPVGEVVLNGGVIAPGNRPAWAVSASIATVPGADEPAPRVWLGAARLTDGSDAVEQDFNMTVFATCAALPTP